MKLIVFDGDDTLWVPLSGLFLSDRTPTDSVGMSDFTFALSQQDSNVAVRDDGARFALRSEAREVLAALKGRRALIGVVSYNHEGNVRRVLEAFGLLTLFDYVVAEWHTNKDRMLQRMLDQARGDGHTLHPSDLLLIDDDPQEFYREQCARIGVGFACFGEGKEISDLREVLALLDAMP